MEDTAYPESDPLHHTIKIKGLLNDLIEHLQEDAEKIDEPKAQTLFTASADVLRGLRTAFEHYEEQPEPDTFSPND